MHKVNAVKRMQHACDTVKPKYDNEIAKHDNEIPKHDKEIPKYDNEIPKNDSEIPKCDGIYKPWTANIISLENNLYQPFSDLLNHDLVHGHILTCPFGDLKFPYR